MKAPGSAGGLFAEAAPVHGGPPAEPGAFIVGRGVCWTKGRLFATI